MSGSSQSSSPIRSQPAGPPQTRISIDRYRVDADGYWLTAGSPKSPTLERLTNFIAVIKLQRIFDTGNDADLRREYVIEASSDSHNVRFEVSAEEFTSMEWPERFLGSGSIVYPGFQHREHAATAIKLFSGNVPTEHYRNHTGWALTEGRYAFLHATGALGVGQAGANSGHLGSP